MSFNWSYKILLIAITFSFIAQSCDIENEKTKENLANKINDSISNWIKDSKNKSLPINIRKSLILKSYQTLKSSKIDSLEVRKLSEIAYQNFKLGDTLIFKKKNKEALFIATKLKDTFALGDLHWNYASYYNKIHVYDSAYYHFNKASNYFDKTGYINESAKTQYGMAFIQGRFKDYSGSEISTFKAIEKFKKIDNFKSLYSCYNHLALLQNDIQEYDKALFYNQKALEFIDKLENTQTLYEISLNNIGNVYLKKGDYTKALDYFNEKLKSESLKERNINSFAITIDNKAYCKLLMKDTVNVNVLLNYALHIRDSLNDKGGIVISKIHLAHYYAFKQDTSYAFKYAQEANVLAKKIKNSRDYLETLALLGELDPKNSSEYLANYIEFSDSLQIKERKIQNKFTRIAYETDEYIKENEYLSQQKIWILGSGLGLVSILGLLYYIKIQKVKTEKLFLENEQQKANEQVYLISLKQQEKLEKEKVKERNRIAEELHDGILGKLFGTRVGLGFLEIQGDKVIKEKHQFFLDELQIIEKEIREVSHILNTNFDSSQISFTTVIIQLIKNKSRIGSFKYSLDFDTNINWGKINEIIKVNLYRVTQEALQNILKYASAKNVSISFSVSNSNLIMMVEDDGIGFKVKQKKVGIGIKNMKSRVEKLEGLFNIYSKPKEGTLIKIQIPI